MNVIEAINLASVVQDLLANSSIVKSNKFVWALTRNKTLMTSVTEDFKASIKALGKPEVTDVFDQHRLELIKKWGILDGAGQPMSENGQYLLTDKKAFDLEFQQLLSDSPEAVAVLKAQDDATAELMQQPCDVEPYMIEFEQLPENLGAEYIQLLAPILLDPK